MKKITLAILAVSLLCSIALMSCKKTEDPKPAEQAQPAEPAKEAPKDAPAEKAKK
ncbi:MAG: hypothetical protein V1874_12615 [Spirochaetota bacterium]